MAEIVESSTASKSVVMVDKKSF